MLEKSNAKRSPVELDCQLVADKSGRWKYHKKKEEEEEEPSAFRNHFSGVY
jgi:hypothetical protein